MVDDFKPARRRAKSLQTGQNDPNKEQTPYQTKLTQSFQTPDEVAAVSDAVAGPLLEPNHPQLITGRQSSSWPKKLSLQWPPSKKEFVSMAVVIVLVVSGVASWVITHHVAKPVAAVTKTKAAPIIPTTVASNLSGLPVAPAINQRPVTGVMIENSDQARPQAGLSQAGVVFEAVAEGGITRFLALYQDTQPSTVGPIRSARPYYVQWVLGFNAGYAHVGGSPDALNDIKNWGVRDLDQFHNSGSYQRVSSRAAPHNVYSGIATLTQLEASKGYNSSTFTSWPRKADAAVKQPTATKINIALSGPDYNPSYSYDAASNSYKRSEGGAPQIDANSGAQLSPKVVAVMVVPESQGTLDATGAYYSNYNVLGTGALYIFQDGMVTSGQWSKTDNSSQISFTDSNGQPIKLDSGQTWLSAVTASTKVSYAP